MILFIVTFAISLFVLSVCGYTHYYALHKLQVGVLSKVKSHFKRFYLIFFTLLFVHAFEVFLFALAFFFLNVCEFGSLEGVLGHYNNFSDYLYFSVSVYSTLGIGDIYPTGGLKFLAGTEAIFGLMLIAWSATFVYFHMEKKWLGIKN